MHARGAVSGAGQHRRHQPAASPRRHPAKRYVPINKGLLCDLLWADPQLGVSGWGENERGISYTFGENLVEFVTEKFDLDIICRAHQVVEDGYQFFGKRKLVTVFSAPNYMGQFDNSGAIMVVNEDLMCSFKILKPA